MITRRRLIVALGAGAFATSVRSYAQQQGTVWRIGFLALRRPASLDADAFGAFAPAMRELGYAEGRNLAIEWRFAGTIDRLPELAAELVRSRVDVIVTAGIPAATAAQKATKTIPIVMATSNDPVGSGLVKSLARPGGNITGLSSVAGEISPKHLEMLLAMVPKLTYLAVLLNPDNSAHPLVLKNVQAAARKAGVKIMSVEARSAQDIDKAFSIMTQQNARAVLLAPDGFFIQQSRQIAELAAKHRLPSISARAEFVEAGGLMSYGQNLADQLRRAATYVDKIFKGAKPADLPIEQSAKFELAINGKTAKALGLTIPQALMISADKVIE